MSKSVLIIDGKEIEIPQSMIDEIKGKLKKEEYHTFRFKGNHEIDNEDGINIAYIGNGLVSGDFEKKVILINKLLQEVEPSFVGAQKHFRAFIQKK